MCFDFLHKLGPKHFSFKEELRDMIKMCIGLHIKCQLLSSDFYENLIFSTYFRKIFIYQISWKIYPWRSKQSLFATLRKPLKTYTLIMKLLPRELRFRINEERVLKADEVTQSFLMTSALGPQLASLPLYTSPPTFGWRDAAAADVWRSAADVSSSIIFSGH